MHGYLPLLMLLPALLTALTSCCGCKEKEKWGRFPGPLDVRSDGNGRDWSLLKDFAFVDQNDKRWNADKDKFTWNGASIPLPAWVLVGSPFIGCHRKASVVHDFYYQNHVSCSETRKNVDVMYYHACRAGGMGWVNANVQYYCLRWFGKRWGDKDDLPFTQQEKAAFLTGRTGAQSSHAPAGPYTSDHNILIVLSNYKEKLEGRLEEKGLPLIDGPLDELAHRPETLMKGAKVEVPAG